MIHGIGTDIIEISRIQKAVERWGDTFLKHVLNDAEIKYAQKYKFPWPHYAGRFAAKEAIFKALGDTSCTWKDLTIINYPDGKPHCQYSKSLDHKKIILSISHSKHYATAVAIVETIS